MRVQKEVKLYVKMFQKHGTEPQRWFQPNPALILLDTSQKVP